MRLHVTTLFVLLLLSKDVTSQDLALDVVDLKSPEEYSAMVQRADKLRNEGDPTGAMNLLAAVLQDGADNESYFRSAEFAMGKTLFALELYQGAYTWFERIAEAGDGHPHYIETIDWLLQIQRAVPGDAASLERLADFDPMLYPPANANEIRYLVGSYYYASDELDQAIESLESVEAANEQAYLKAQYLLGVIHTRKDAAQPALEAFKNILRYQRDVSNNAFVSEIAKKATLALGRVFYTAQQFDTAARYYDQIDQSDPAWLDSLFEISWAYFRTQNYDRALGNLHTLNSPYFANEYFPESYVLEAVLLLSNCHHVQALQTVDRFVATYKPLKDELEVQLKQTQAPNEFYRYLAQLSKQGAEAELSPQLKRVINAALRDAKLRRLLSYVLQLNRENEKLDGMVKTMPDGAAKRFSLGVLSDLTAYRELVVTDAGKAAKSRLDRVYQELTGLITDALRVRVETLKAQRELLKLEQTMTADQVAALRPGAREAPPTDVEHEYWPFDGEYWRDELGAYTFLIADRCLRQPAPTPSQPTPTQTPSLVPDAE